MRPQNTREKNPYNKPAQDPRISVPWGERDGYELGYQRTYGEYGSNARGWVDKAHSKNWPRHDYGGVAPKSYRRSDESLLEHIAQLLTWDQDVDASDITIAVKDGNVTLSGTVPDKEMIHIVDEIMEQVHGVRDYDNHIKKQKNR